MLGHFLGYRARIYADHALSLEGPSWDVHYRAGKISPTNTQVLVQSVAHLGLKIPALVPMADVRALQKQREVPRCCGSRRVAVRAGAEAQCEHRADPRSNGPTPSTRSVLRPRLGVRHG